MLYPNFTPPKQLWKDKAEIRLDFWHDKIYMGHAYVIIHPDDSMGIWNVQIFEDFRGKGFGTQMMTEVLQYIQDNFRQQESVFLNVFFDNEPAKKVYEKVGFIYAKKISRKIRGYGFEKSLSGGKYRMEYYFKESSQ